MGGIADSWRKPEINGRRNLKTKHNATLNCDDPFNPGKLSPINAMGLFGANKLKAPLRVRTGFAALKDPEKFLPSGRRFDYTHSNIKRFYFRHVIVR